MRTFRFITRKMRFDNLTLHQLQSGKYAPDKKGRVVEITGKPGRRPFLYETMDLYPSNSGPKNCAFHPLMGIMSY